MRHGSRLLLDIVCGSEMKLNKKIIVFAPHPDDETLGCGGVIAKKRSEGYEVIIVVLTDGRHAFSKVLGIYSDPTPKELKKIRKKEVQKATKILGVQEENLIFLEFEDGSLEKFQEEAEEKVIQILKKNVPEEIYFPYKKDANLDHGATNQIVKNALKKLGLKSKRYQYSILHKRSLIGPKIDALHDLIKRNRIHVDISSFLLLKKKAIDEFKSKITVIANKQQEPIYKNLDPWLKNKETFYVDK